MKLSPRTIALWAQVLHAVPGIAPAAQGAVAAGRRRPGALRERFAAHGIAADRLSLHGPSGLAEMMQAYGEVDLALDPTPYNGGTTTLQALWMGVPVVSLAGGNFVSRMGASFLNTLGQPGLGGQRRSRLRRDRRATGRRLPDWRTSACRLARTHGGFAAVRHRAPGSPSSKPLRADVGGLLQRQRAAPAAGSRPAVTHSDAEDDSGA
jgi:hypothetical protein